MSHHFSGRVRDGLDRRHPKDHEERTNKAFQRLLRRCKKTGVKPEDVPKPPGMPATRWQEVCDRVRSELSEGA